MGRRHFRQARAKSAGAQGCGVLREVRVPVGWWLVEVGEVLGHGHQESTQAKESH